MPAERVLQQQSRCVSFRHRRVVFSVKGNYYRPVLAIVFRPLINYAKSIGTHQPHDAIAPAA